MKLSQIFKQKKLSISFEVFPPRTEAGMENVVKELAALSKYKPAFVSVTYGAGGGSQDRTITLCRKIATETGYTVMPHLTCIGSKPEKINKFLAEIKNLGAENILALRGDCPRNNPAYSPESDHFQHAVDLIDFIKKNSNLEIAVAGFPEVHPESVTLAEDLKYLKMKVDQGAAAVITQLFFNNKDYLKFVESARQTGIRVPIIPGIMPIVSLASLQKIPELCDAEIPATLRQAIVSAANDAEVKKIGIAYAVRQIKELLNYGIPGIHLYFLNKADTAIRVLDQIPEAY